MLIEELIRIGRPLIEGGFDAAELLPLITDVGDTRARNFYRHVFVLELPPYNSGTEPSALPMQVWGSELDDDFQVDTNRAVGAPILLPSGGNSLNPQGRYGIPVYPCWDAHFQSFRQSVEKALDFLRGRVNRTLGVSLPEDLLEAAAKQFQRAVTAAAAGPREKWLGVLILARPEEGGVYRYAPRQTRSAIGASALTAHRFVVPDLDKILQCLWAARLAEGADQGRRSGVCSFSGEEKEVISPYCTVWPWASLTWTCPLPQSGDVKLLVEGIGLGESSYRSLTAGACVFRRLTRPVHSIVVHELFAPATDREGRNLTSRRNLSDLTQIYGSAFMLPLQERNLTESGARGDFVSGMRAILQSPRAEGSLTDRYLSSVLGFDSFLPEEMDKEDYRLTLVYFSGNPGHGDIHLRAYIQDVMPSTIRRLQGLTRPTAEEAVRLLRLIIPGATEKQRAYVATCYQSVPYLLARAYGGSHLWAALEQALHRRRLDPGRLISNAATRMASLVPRWPKSRNDLFDEVLFYLCCRSFMDQYNGGLASDPGEDAMPMRPWRELIQALERDSITELRYQSVGELGFGCGVLLRRFSRLYWRATQVGKEGKDYLKHRVLTFGADLSPDLVQKQGLKGMFEVAAKIKTIRFGRDLQERVGLALSEFDRLKDQIRSNRDEFMTAFWSGYSLQGYDRPLKGEICPQCGQIMGKNKIHAPSRSARPSQESNHE